MAILIHIIGAQGAGKTWLSELIASGLSQQSKSVRIVQSDESLYCTNEHARAFASEVVIVEAEQLSPRHGDLQGTDVLLTLARSQASLPKPATSERLERGDVVEHRTGLKKSERARRIKLGTFPRPVSIGERAVAWRSGDIDAWIASLKPKDEA